MSYSCFKQCRVGDVIEVNSKLKYVATEDCIIGSSQNESSVKAVNMATGVSTFIYWESYYIISKIIKNNNKKLG